MQMVKKVSLIVFLVWLAVLVFMPKRAFYYSLEEALAQKDIRLNEAQINEGWFGLDVENVTLYVKGIEIAKIKEISFFTVLFYTSIQIEDVQVDEALHSKVPASIQEATLTHTLFMPLSVSVDANGSFGQVEGKVNLLEGTTHLDFTKATDIKTLKSFLKKNEKGWYYEGSF